MAITVVQDKYFPFSSWNHSGQPFVMNSLMTAGSCVIVSIGGFNGTITSISGGGCASWVRESHLADGSHVIQEVWYGLNSSGAAGSDTVTLTWTPYNSSISDVNITEFSNVQTTETVVDSITGTTGAFVPAASGSITPTASANLLLYGCSYCYYNTHFTAASTGFTALAGFTGNISFMPSYEVIASATGSYNNSPTSVGHGGGLMYMNWASVIIAFKAAGGSPPVVNKGLLEFF